MNRYVIGMPNMGKSVFVLQEIIRDMHDGNTVVVLDPNGDLIDAALLHFPKRRIGECVLIDPTDESPIGWNPLANVRNKPLAAELLKDTLKVLAGYETSPTPVMERMLYTTIASLLSVPDMTLLDIEPMLTDKAFRRRVLERVSDPVLSAKWSYWEKEYAGKDWKLLVSSTENKAGDFSEDPRIRTVLSGNTFDLEAALFDQRIIFLRLPQLELGSKARLFGSLFLAYTLATCARLKAPPINIYIDDCHVFDTPVLRRVLANSRRLNLNVSLVNQYLGQLSPELKTAILGSAEIRVMFRTGIEDSGYLHRSLPENNTAPMLHELALYRAIYFDGRHSSRIEEIRSRPLPKGNVRIASKVVEQSRRRYGLKKRRG